MDDHIVFTGKGFRLERLIIPSVVPVFAFQCGTRMTQMMPGAGWQQLPFVLSQLTVFAPFTADRLRDTLRGWLTPLHDEELLIWADRLADEALGGVAGQTPQGVPPATPPPPPVASAPPSGLN
jgi:hypothetical protein